MVRNIARKGFTLVELSLSMVFIGVLSISVVLIISNTVAAYQRGLTLTRANTMGTNLVDDMRTAVHGSSVNALLNSCSALSFKDASGKAEALPTISQKACMNDYAYKHTYVVHREAVTVNGTTYSDDGGLPIYGAFCTGKFSYIWNSGYFEADEAEFTSKNFGGAKLVYLNKAKERLEVKDFRLIRVQDQERAVCLAMSDKDVDGITKSYGTYENSMIDITEIGSGIIEEEVTDLLPINGGNDLALYDLYVSQPAANTNESNLFYSVSFILGTVTGGANIMAKGNSCVAPKEAAHGNYNYCAINKFNFAVQVNGG